MEFFCVSQIVSYSYVLRLVVVSWHPLPRPMLPLLQPLQLQVQPPVLRPLLLRHTTPGDLRHFVLFPGLAPMLIRMVQHTRRILVANRMPLILHRLRVQPTLTPLPILRRLVIPAPPRLTRPITSKPRHRPLQLLQLVLPLTPLQRSPLLAILTRALTVQSHHLPTLLSLPSRGFLISSLSLLFFLFGEIQSRTH